MDHTELRTKLMSLETYARLRKQSRAEAIAHRRRRSAALGEHMTIQFEDEATVLRQVQEMLHIEKIFDDEGIEAELEAYAPLIPDGSNWKATLLLEYPDVVLRRRALSRLIGVEDRVFVEVEGQPRVYALADEDLERENEEKTSAVHFLRWELSPAMIATVHAGAAVTLGCDHPAYPAHTSLEPATLASLAADLKEPARLA